MFFFISIFSKTGPRLKFFAVFTLVVLGIAVGGLIFGFLNDSNNGKKRNTNTNTNTNINTNTSENQTQKCNKTKQNKKKKNLNFKQTFKFKHTHFYFLNFHQTNIHNFNSFFLLCLAAQFLSYLGLFNLYIYVNAFLYLPAGMSSEASYSQNMAQPEHTEVVRLEEEDAPPKDDDHN